MVHFVGAGSGAADLITVRGAKLLSEADVVIYAGSLVNPALLAYTREGCASTAQYGSSLTSWKNAVSPTMSAPASAPSAARRPLCGRSTPCPM